MSIEKTAIEFQFSHESKNYMVFKKERQKSQIMFPDVIYLDKKQFKKPPAAVNLRFEVVGA